MGEAAASLAGGPFAPPDFHGFPAEVVPVAQVEVDDKYQRPQSTKKVKGLIRNFDPYKVAPPILSRRKNPDGSVTYYVVEGQHTLEALKQLGYTHWYCIVHDDLSIQEEASVWVGINTSRTKPTTRDRYQALYTKGDPDTLEIERMLNRYGLSGISSSGKHVLKAVGAPSDIIEKYGWGVLNDTLDLCTRTWSDRSKIRRFTLLAVAKLIHVYGKDLDKAHFRERFTHQEPEVLEAAAKALNRQNHYFTIPTALAHKMAMEYNHGRRSKRLDVSLIDSAGNGKAA